jgi:cytochrome P450
VVRRLADAAFTRQATEGHTEDIRRIVDTVIDRFIDRGEVDFTAEFANVLPLLVILHVTGIPLELEDDFAQWGTDYFSLIASAPPLTPERERDIAARGKRVMRWMYEYVGRRRAEPAHDLISHLIQATTPDGDPQLTDDEIVGVINSNLVAGVETTATYLPELIVALLGERELWEQLQSDRSLVPKAVEEGLRYWSPSRGVMRRATVDTEIGDARISAGENIWVPFVAADHDPEVFEEPERFDLHRPNLNKHIAFGKGTHLCIGAQLTRKEVVLAIEQMQDRLPNLRLVAADGLGGPHLITLPRFGSVIDTSCIDASCIDTSCIRVRPTTGATPFDGRRPGRLACRAGTRKALGAVCAAGFLPGRIQFPGCGREVAHHGRLRASTSGCGAQARPQLFCLMEPCSTVASRPRRPEPSGSTP